MKTLFFFILFLFGLWLVGRSVSFLNTQEAEMSIQGMIRMLLGGLMTGPLLLVLEKKLKEG